MHYSTMQGSTNAVLYNAVQYSDCNALHSALHCSTVQYMQIKVVVDSKVLHVDEVMHWESYHKVGLVF